MDRTETLAGLAEVLAAYSVEPESRAVADWPPDERDAYREAGGFMEGNEAVLRIRRRKLAAVVLAHLEAQGWAHGREEFSVRTAGAGRMSAEGMDQAKERAQEADAWGFPATVERRRVSEWVPAEDADG